MTTELTGADLARAVAEARGYNCIRGDEWEVSYWVDDNQRYVDDVEDYRPDLNWGQAGELLEEYEITLKPWNTNIDTLKWLAYTPGAALCHVATTPQVAICRAFLAMKGEG